jgi:hypothetical protein
MRVIVDVPLQDILSPAFYFRDSVTSGGSGDMSEQILNLSFRGHHDLTLLARMCTQ